MQLYLVNLLGGDHVVYWGRPIKSSDLDYQINLLKENFQARVNEYVDANFKMPTDKNSKIPQQYINAFPSGTHTSAHNAYLARSSYFLQTSAQSSSSKQTARYKIAIAPPVKTCPTNRNHGEGMPPVWNFCNE